MAKGDQEDTRSDVNTAMQSPTAKAPQTQTSLFTGATPGVIASGDAERANILGNYNNMAATGGISDADRSALLATNGVTGPTGGFATAGAGGGSSDSSSSSSNAATGAPQTMNQSAFNDLSLPSYADPYSGYKDMSTTGGVDVSRPTATYGALQANGGQIDPAREAQLNAISGALASGKTLDGSSLYGDVDNSIGNLNQFGKDAGVTADDMNNLNRPLYYENEKTGGYSDTQLADLRARSNAQVPSFYNNLQDTLNQRRQVQGYSPGFDSASQAAARQGAIQSSDAARNTEIGIGDTVRQGKMDAAKQLSANELGLLNITTPAKGQALAAAGSLGLGKSNAQIGAMEGAGSLDLNTQDLINKTKLAAANGDVNAQALIQSGKLQGLAGMTGINTQTFQNAATKAQGQQAYTLGEDQISAARAAAGGANAAAMAGIGLGYANLAATNQRYLTSSTQQGQQAGAQGLLNTYNSSYAPLTQNTNSDLGYINAGNNASLGYLGLLNSNAQQKGTGSQTFQNAMQGFSAGSGALSGLNPGPATPSQSPISDPGTGYYGGFYPGPSDGSDPNYGSGPSPEPGVVPLNPGLLPGYQPAPNGNYLNPGPGNGGSNPWEDGSNGWSY